MLLQPHNPSGGHVTPPPKPAAHHKPHPTHPHKKQNNSISPPKALKHHPAHQKHPTSHPTPASRKSAPLTESLEQEPQDEPMRAVAESGFLH